MVSIPFLSIPVRFVVSIFNVQPSYAYRYKSSKGVSYFLHSKPIGKAKTYFFSRSEDGVPEQLPDGMVVMELPNGLPYIAKRIEVEAWQQSAQALPDSEKVTLLIR